MILLNPGPVTLSHTVRAALQKPDLCHRESEFFLLQQQIRQQLLDVYQLEHANWLSVLLSGSGSAAVEAMLTSLVPQDGKLLILENGVYGERMRRIAEIHRIRHATQRHTWGDELDLIQLADRLASDRSISHIALVHHETTTGRLNQLAPLARLCLHYDVELLLDGVSSFGAEAIDFSTWPIAAVAASANKCLHGVPGLSFVIASRRALAHSCQPPRSLYLDLAAYAEAQEADSTPFTPAIPAYYALHQALCELEQQGGWLARHRRYFELAEQVSQGFISQGVAPFLPVGASSVVQRAYRLPSALDYAHLHQALKQQGFVIYAGQGVLTHQIFRVSTMGQISNQDIARLLSVTQPLFSAVSAVSPQEGCHEP